ncbi:patatin-like phospholipase family protein [Caviibacter abscessus]|uniref:patatin-like phospholipase family protein n=1 Tax=Caviibacter abscessus TaxID=1766719 RepID=UPI000831628F|nr:patatin-like phospholipase family protein [Caviibacter abscessus]
MFKILCLDGGGARGYFTSYMIKKIEEEYNIKAYEYFDLIVGTSTGALIAGAIGLGIDINEIIDMYLNQSKMIFKTRPFPNNGAIGSKFSREYISNLIHNKYQNKSFEDLKTKVIITATDVTTGLPIIIKSWKKNKLNLIDSVLSSSSAPCYFDPFPVEDTYFTDGCIWANNPVLVGLSQAVSEKEFNKSIDEIKILSIGTGKNISKKEIEPLSIPFSKGDKKWGIVGWGFTLPNLFLQSSVIANDMIIKDIIKSPNYARIEYFTDIKLSVDKIPTKLIHEKDRIFNEHRHMLDEFFKTREVKIETKKYNFIQKLAKKIFKI